MAYNTTIPEIGSEYPKEPLDSTHPEFKANAAKYRFLRESADLTGGYAPNLAYENWLGSGMSRPTHNLPTSRTYLERKNGEHQEDYITRLRNAKPVPFVRDGLSLLTGVLTSQTVDRQHYPKPLQRALENVTSTGVSWRVFIENSVLPLLLKFGWMGVLCTRKPDLSGVNLLTVSPENIDQWCMIDGAIDWARIVTEVELPFEPWEEPATETQYIHITKTGWFTVADRDKKPIVIDSGYWQRNQKPLAHNPLVIWELPDRSTPAYEAALEQLKFFNVESGLQHIENMTAYPQLVWPVEDMGDKEDIDTIKRGPGYIMFYTAGNSTQKPELLSPSKVPFDHLSDRLRQIMFRAYHAFGVSLSISDTSGISLAHGQFQSSHLYRSLAKACEQGEHRTLQSISELLNIEYTSAMRVDWPTSFSSLQETILIDGLQTYLELEPGIDGALSAYMKMYSVLMPGLTDREKQRVEADTRAALEKRNGAVKQSNPNAGRYLTNTLGEGKNPENMQGTRDADGR